MSEGKAPGRQSFGVFERRAGEAGWTLTEAVAAALSALWLLGACLFFLIAGTGGAGPLQLIMAVIAILMPVALVWVAASAARAARELREETAQMRAAVEAIRQDIVARGQASGTVVRPDVEKRLDDLAAAQRETRTALATFATARAALRDEAARESVTRAVQGKQAAPEVRAAPRVVAEPAAAPAELQAEAQVPLAFGPEASVPPPAPSDIVIRALNFPADAQDKDGFRALRVGLRDPRVARLIQAAQDTLTLMSQDGIYMDDLAPDRARPEIWRKFAGGERGRAISGLGGIRDRTALALAGNRMRDDSIFRDVAHHFLRTFDHTFAQMAEHLSDAQIVRLTDTRTARAFMLLGRVTGIFD